MKWLKLVPYLCVALWSLQTACGDIKIESEDDEDTTEATACTSDENCDDELSCTLDKCEGEEPSCTHQIEAGACLVDGVCYAEGDASTTDPCFVCDPAAATTSLSPKQCEGSAVCNATTGACEEPATDTVPEDTITPDTEGVLRHGRRSHGRLHRSRRRQRHRPRHHGQLPPHRQQRSGRPGQGQPRQRL